MLIKDAIQMMKMYAKCPVCGAEEVGESCGSIEIDTCLRTCAWPSLIR